MIICKHLHKSYSHGPHRKEVLRDLNLTINRGDRIALLGRNGAGKSTLIKLIGGVELPSSGRVIRQMPVSWPLGFNGGFQGSLTGYDNAKFIARIYGRDYSQLRDFVEEFSELGRQMRMPVKTYSSGMRARLAFALSLAIDFDCYLVDEVIMVGDQSFSRKCRIEMLEKRLSRTMVLASHSTDTIREMCNRAIVIHQGSATEYESVDEAVDIYVNL